LLKNRPPVSDGVRNIDEIDGVDRYLVLFFKGSGCDCCILVVIIIADSDDSSIGRVV